MITAVATAGKLDGRGWLIGIFRAFISGGSSAVVSGLGAMGIANDKFNLSTNVGNTLKLVGLMFVFQGGYRLFEYLQLHPVPDQVQQSLDSASASAKQTVDAIADAKDAAGQEKKP